MQVPGGEFKSTASPTVVFGAGSIQRLKEKVDELGGKRAFVITGRTIATKTDLVERIRTILGTKFAGFYGGIQAHVPQRCVIEGAKMAKAAGADLLISLGGSSPVDATKGINLVLTEVEKVDDFFIKYNHRDSSKVLQFKKPKLPFIAIPTTLSASELTVTAGIKDEQTGHKDPYGSPELPAKVVIMDPETTVYTPKELWASTGMKLLSDRFGAVCSLKPLPYADALGLHAIRLVNQFIERSIKEPVDLEARAMLQHAVWISPHGVPSGLSIVASLRHTIGSIYNVGHGVASTIVFPYCLEFNRPFIDDRLAVVATALDLRVKKSSIAAITVINRVNELIKELELPTRLRDAGVPKDGLKVIADACVQEFSMASGFRALSPSDILGILEKAW